MTDDSSIDEEQLEYINLVAGYSREISNNKEELELAFESTVGSDNNINGLDELFSTLATVLSDEVTGEQLHDVVEGIVNIGANLNPDIVAELKDREESLVPFFKRIHSKHNLHVAQAHNRRAQGENWWNNISTSIRVVEDEPLFEHKITVDYRESHRIDSKYSSTAILSRHLLEQLLDAQDVIGYDVVNFADRETIKEIRDASQEILEEQSEE
jgi:hypothetical protein